MLARRRSRARSQRCCSASPASPCCLPDTRSRSATGKFTGIALALAAAILFALGSVRTKAPLPIAPIAQVAWQVGLGCAPMMLFGLAVEQPDFSRLSSTGAAVLIYMTLGPMGLCYLTWFAALRRLPASTAALGTLIVPVIGVIAAALRARRAARRARVLAAALTLGGVALAIRR